MKLEEGTFNENELNSSLARIGMSKATFAIKIGINEATLYRKIKNNGSFNRKEISSMLKIFPIEEVEKFLFGVQLAKRK